MKGKKITSLLVIAVLLLTTLAIAIPVSLAATADPVSIVFASDGTSTPAWTTAGSPVAGTYAVLSTPVGTDRHQVMVAYGKPLSTLVALTVDVAGSPTLDVVVNVYYPADTAGTAAYMELLLDTTGDGKVDASVNGGFDYDYESGPLSYSDWNKGVKHASAGWSIRDVDNDGVLISSTYGGPYDDEGTNGFPVTLAGLDASTDFAIAGDDPIVLYVGAGVFSNTGTTYIDDIIIGGVTYPLEPMFLDEDYYHAGEYVTVTVIDSDQSISVAATVLNPRTSQEFVINLPETSVDGIFEGNFKLVDVTPGTGELLVRDADEFTVNYGTVSITADVDDLAPTITALAPEDKTNTTDTTHDRDWVSCCC